MKISESHSSNKSPTNCSLFPEEDQEIYNLIRRLSIKYNINSNFINKQILSHLINKVMPNCELIEITEITNYIFDNLSQSKSSTVAIYDFVREIKRNRNKIEIPKDSIEKFYKNIFHSLLTKTEGIIYYLKHLQQRKWIVQNSELSRYLSWSILTVTGGDLYDLDTEQFKSKNTNCVPHNGNKEHHKAKIIEETKKVVLHILRNIQI